MIQIVALLNMLDTTFKTKSMVIQTH